MRDLRRELNSHSDGSFPREWKAEPGDLLIGLVMAFHDVTTRHGQRRVVIVENELDGELLTVWLTPVVLRRLFEELQPMPGERVGIKRLSNHAKGYARFRVLVDRESQDALVQDADGDAGPIDNPDGDDSVPF